MNSIDSLLNLAFNIFPILFGILAIYFAVILYKETNQKRKIYEQELKEKIQLEYMSKLSFGVIILSFCYILLGIHWIMSGYYFEIDGLADVAWNVLESGVLGFFALLCFLGIEFVNSRIDFKVLERKNAKIAGLYKLSKEKDKKLQLNMEITNAENEILHDIANNTHFSEVIKKICVYAEKFCGNIYCSVLLNNNEKLYDFWSPSLNESYKALLKDGFPIGPDNGACGAAAYFKDYYFAEDITTDPNWVPFPIFIEECQKMEIKSVWSSPILTDNERILGTIAFYSKTKGIPNNICKKLLDWAVQIAGIAITQYKTKQRLDNILESQLDCVIRVRPDLSLTYANKTHCQIFYGTETCEQEILEKQIYSEDLPLLKNFMEQVQQPPYRAICIIRSYIHSGELRTFQWEGVAILDNAGNIVEFQGVGRDVTEREKAENALAFHCKELYKKNRLLEAIINSAGSYLWYKDHDHKYLFCDVGFQNDFFRITERNEIIGKNDIEMLNLFRARTTIKHDFGKLCIGTDIHSKDQKTQCRYIEGGYIGDKLFVLEVIKSPLFTEDGKYMGNIGAAWNRSEEMDTLVQDKEELIKQGRLEVLSKNDYPQSPFVWWIKPRTTYYRGIMTLPLIEDSSILEQRIREEKPIQSCEILKAIKK